MRFIVFTLFTLFSANTLAGVLWYCTAVGKNGATWNQFAQSRTKALVVVRKKCRAFDKHQLCNSVCLTPRNYWRCLSHDSVPEGVTQPYKQGTWAWTSYSKQIAINGAKDACRYNSAFGGCYVNPDSCASS